MAFQAFKDFRSYDFISDAQLDEAGCTREAWEANVCFWVVSFMRYNFNNGDIVSLEMIHRGMEERDPMARPLYALDYAGIRFAFAELEHSGGLERAQGAGRWFIRMDI